MQVLNLLVIVLGNEYYIKWLWLRFLKVVNLLFDTSFGVGKK